MQCKRRGPKLMVVPACAKYQFFFDKLTLLPLGARCCPGHLSDNYFHNHAVEQISQTRTTSDFNHSDLTLWTEILNIASRENQRCIYFDNRNSLSDADILNLTGQTCNNFNDLCGIIQKGTLGDSRVWGVRTCLGIFRLECQTKLYVLYLIWEEILSDVLSHLLENASQKTLFYHNLASIISQGKK